MKPTTVEELIKQIRELQLRYRELEEKYIKLLKKPQAVDVEAIINELGGFYNTQPQEKYLRNILLKHLTPKAEQEVEICMRCGVERKEVKREGSHGCHSRGFHYPKHLWK